MGSFFVFKAYVNLYTKKIVMNIKNISSARTIINFIESATEVQRIKKYLSKQIVEDFLGLSISKAYFYGEEIGTNNVDPLPITQTSFDSDVDVVLLIEGVVELENAPINNGAGGIVYTGSGSLKVGDSTIYSGVAIPVASESTLGGVYLKDDAASSTLTISTSPIV